MTSSKYYDYRPMRSSRLSKTWNQDELPAPMSSTIAVNYNGVTAHLPNSSAKAAIQRSLPQLDPSMNTPFNSPASLSHTRGNKGVFSRGSQFAKSVPPLAVPRLNHLPNRPLGPAGHAGYGGAPQRPASTSQGTLPELLREFGTNEIAVSLYHDNRVLFQMYITCQTVHGITNRYSSAETNFAPQAIEDYRFPRRVLAARHSINQVFTEVEVACHNPYNTLDMRREKEKEALSWLTQARRHHKHTFLASSYELNTPAAQHEQMQWGKPFDAPGHSPVHPTAPICTRAIVRFVEDMSIVSSIDEARRHALQGDWTWRSPF